MKTKSPISENYYRKSDTVDQSIAQCLPNCGYSMGSVYRILETVDERNPDKCPVLARYDDREEYKRGRYNYRAAHGEAYLLMSRQEALAAENISGMVTWRGKQVQKGIWECEWAEFDVSDSANVPKPGYYNGEVKMTKARGYVVMQYEVGDVKCAGYGRYYYVTSRIGYHTSSLPDARAKNKEYTEFRKAHAKECRQWDKEQKVLEQKRIANQEKARMKKEKEKKEKARIRRLIKKQHAHIENEPVWQRCKEYVNTDAFAQDLADTLDVLTTRYGACYVERKAIISHLKKSRKFWKEYQLTIEHEDAACMVDIFMRSDNHEYIVRLAQAMQNSHPRVVAFREWMNSDMCFVDIANTQCTICAHTVKSTVLVGSEYVTQSRYEFNSFSSGVYEILTKCGWGDIKDLVYEEFKSMLLERYEEYKRFERATKEERDAKRLEEAKQIIDGNEFIQRALNYKYSYKDSIASGNCRPGTEGFASNNHLDLDSTCTGTVLFRLAKHSGQMNNIRKMIYHNITVTQGKELTQEMHDAIKLIYN